MAPERFRRSGSHLHPPGLVAPYPTTFARFAVIDSGFSRQDDQEVSYDPLAPRRNAATFISLAVADEVLALWAGDPVGGCNDSSAG